MKHADKKEQTSSLFGLDLLGLVAQYADYRDNAYQAARYVVTHGGRYPLEQAVRALEPFDAEAFKLLERHPEIAIAADPGAEGGAGGGVRLAMYVNSLGRLHLRPATEPRPIYDADDRFIDIGHVNIDRPLLDAIVEATADVEAHERRQFARIKAAVDDLDRNGELPDVLEQVIDHVEHVESVCFYVRDRFYALIDRFTNLIDTKGGKGFLSALRAKPYAAWTDDEILVVAALHALFISGRSVRFEEFNGITLTARGLWEKLTGLLEAYRGVGCEFEIGPDANLFDVARTVRDQTLKAVGKDWLRYRWIYGLTFQKTERVLASTRSTESETFRRPFFTEDFEELTGRRADTANDEHDFFMQLAAACLDRDVAKIPCDRGSSAVTGWIEYLMEKIVASAVLATDADYGMSSSLRNIGRLLQPDEQSLVDVMNGLQPGHFFTCFVSRGFRELPESTADTIASSVQKRMMFNRWHFFPGNFERSRISKSRHWYYPPLVPDIAVHSDMHRASHSRAQIKFSVRAPGPDMSRPALTIGAQRYRGFYDVRIVRMSGQEFSTEEMVRTRRRALWMECVYDVLVAHLEGRPAEPLAIEGFQPGEYLDILPSGHPSGAGVHRTAEAAAALS
ncbi:MAG TPA: hypothetical protein VK943_15855 [Arenibaculum sp.]|nr:hypothetical protein [Arenibaculum sp.]